MGTVDFKFSLDFQQSSFHLRCLNILGFFPISLRTVTSTFFFSMCKVSGGSKPFAYLFEVLTWCLLRIRLFQNPIRSTRILPWNHKYHVCFCALVPINEWVSVKGRKDWETNENKYEKDHSKMMFAFIQNMDTWIMIWTELHCGML